MRRFSRRRRNAASKDTERTIDAEQWLGRLRDSETLAEANWSPLLHEDVSAAYCLVLRSENEAGTKTVACFSPSEGGDALLAALATGARLAAEESYEGEILAIAPRWSIRARRRLGLVRSELPYKLRAVAAVSLLDEPDAVESESDLEPTALPMEALAAQLESPSDRALFLRAAHGLQGLASKHGGATRALGRQVELVVSARRLAELRIDGRELVLTTWGQQRASRRIDSDSLVDVLDQLEGQVRRRINDRKIREGEEGLRARGIPLIVQAAELRDSAIWPLGGSDTEELDVVGLRGDGRPAAAAIRSKFDLPQLGSFLDGLQRLRLAQATLFARANSPVILQAPEMLLAASEFSSGLLRTLSGLAGGYELFRAEEDREKGLFLTSVGLEEAARSINDVREERRRKQKTGRGGRRRPSSSESDKERSAAAPRSDAEPEEEAKPSERTRNRRRSRRRGQARPGEADAKEASGKDEAPSFDEVSLFELSEPQENAAERTGAKRGSRSRRGRGGSGSSRSTTKENEASRADQTARATPAGGENGSEDEVDDFSDEIDENLAVLPNELALEPDTPDPGYDDEEEVTQLASSASAVEPVVADGAEIASESPQPVEPAPKPRRRAVIVAAADRDSVGAAILLARDLRFLESILIYPQADLMNVFREVTTDLGDDIPIHLVGFVPSPAGEVLQAASLYRDRINWYDHHDWPPEDLFAMQQAIGVDAIHHTPGVGSSLPVVLENSSRRSRFSDKLVDLMTGRFSQHDYERWGRLWWWRLGEIAQRSGDVRHDIDALMAGRPSDLAQEAKQVDTAPIPSEVKWVSERDFKLVHFAGHVMVVLEVDAGMDSHLAARIARERYGAHLSLARSIGEESFALTGDEVAGRRSLDFGRLVQHLAEKLEWVRALASQDHVARFSISELAAHPERLQETIGEIAMGRTILEN